MDNKKSSLIITSTNEINEIIDHWHAIILTDVPTIVKRGTYELVVHAFCYGSQPAGDIAASAETV